MQAAWEQLGDVLAAERAFSLARLARDVLKRVEVRHLAKLSPDRVLAVMSPARARVALAAGAVAVRPHARRHLPHELFDGAMRRLASPRRATLKMARWRERASDCHRSPRRWQRWSSASPTRRRTLASIDPNRFVPDGILGSRSYDACRCPATSTTWSNLLPYVGLASR